MGYHFRLSCLAGVFATLLAAGCDSGACIHRAGEESQLSCWDDVARRDCASKFASDRRCVDLGYVVSWGNRHKKPRIGSCDYPLTLQPPNDCHDHVDLRVASWATRPASGTRGHANNVAARTTGSTYRLATEAARAPRSLVRHTTH